jgi:predicted nucleotidyltransferase
MRMDMCRNIQRQVKAYFKNREEVVAVYLFGSYAKGKERPLSDVDIGILLDKKCLDNSSEMRELYMVQLARALRMDIHPVLLNSASEALLKQVFLTGKCILVRDAGKLARYKMMVFAAIAEFGYYRSQMQSGLIKRLKRGLQGG